MNVAAKIHAIVTSRRSQLPGIAAEKNAIDGALSALASLEAALVTLARDPKADPELGSLVAANVPAIRELLLQAHEFLLRLEARFSRPTVNIGVSGQARVGKSTLLQTLSGLGDEALPTGTGQPVTAVRSVIVNSERALATLQMHDFTSFRADVLVPYFEALQLEGVPNSLAEFTAMGLPSPTLEGDNGRNVMLQRLAAMQEASRYIGELLTGKPHVVQPLSQLRPWVAYPGRGERAADARFLAVRHARVECPFPHADVGALGLVDLPGLGEIAAAAEEQHVRGLREEVDFVLLVKRAVEGMAYWRSEDAKARRLVDEARAPIRRAADFLGIVSNEGGVDDDTLKNMLDDIASKANAGMEADPLTIYRCRGKDRSDVGERLLAPVLAHLGERLPVMDGELTAWTRGKVSERASEAKRRLHQLRVEVQRRLPETGDVSERVEEETKRLQAALARALQVELAALRSAARADRDDEVLVAAIAGAHREIREWADGGLGRGRDEWIDAALGRFAVNRTSAIVAADELNRARVHIGEVYCRLDAPLRAAVEELWDRLGAAFVAECPALFSGETGTQALRALEGYLDSDEATCPNLKTAVSDILSLRVTYRTHFHPQVREHLDELEHVREDENGDLVPMIASQPLTAAGAVALLSDLADRSRHASHEVRNALMANTTLLAKILYAAAEQFEDSFIRSGTSELEFKRFCRAWRGELFPDALKGVEARSGAVRAVNSAFTAASASFGSLGATR